MAISQTYCDFATGNDYKGATFTDGSFDNATLTLTKTGAFAASRVNHWLYLDDNGSGEVTPGYYRITTVTSNDAVVLHADIRSGANDPTDVVCTQHDGTTTLPWRSVQGALDLITRDSTNGDQVNVKAGSVNLAAAQLVLTTYGTPTRGASLVLRGYTATANDGGAGEIRASFAATLFAAANNYVRCIDLTFSGTTGGNFFLLTLGTQALVEHCTLNLDSTGGGRINGGVKVASGLVARNYISPVQFQAIYGGTAYGNFISIVAGVGYAIVTGTAIGNIILVSGGVGGISAAAEGSITLGNIVYSTIAHTGKGIVIGSTAISQGASAFNNIVVGFSGAGGVGLDAGGYVSVLRGHNAFYNNTTDQVAGIVQDDLGGDVSLAADPFVDAANGDFSLTPAAKAALAGKGFPTEYLGAHANTVPNITIGAIQQVLATSGGGFPKIASVLGRTRM